jgi:hypothetical protein
VNTLVTELGKKLAERWVALLVLPGLLFTATAAAAAVLGHRHWADLALLEQRLGQLLPPPGAGASGDLFRTALLLVVLLVAAVGSGLLAGALTTPVERVLSGRWPAPLRRPALACTRRRHAAWTRAHQEWERAHDAGDRDRLGELAERRNRIAWTEPANATWIGDRLDAPTLRVHQEYGVDLAFLWPRLWLLLPETSRTPLTDARRQLDDAARLGGWALLYLGLGAVWWPSALIGVVVGLVSRQRCRSAADVYAGLVEAAVDVHLDELLDRFTDEQGVRPTRPHWGQQITERFRKGI